MRYLRFIVPLLVMLGMGFCPHAAYAGEGTLDSLRSVIRNHPQDTTKAMALCELAFQLNRSGGEDPRPYLKEALQISIDKQFKKGQGFAWGQYGVYYQMHGAYDEAEIAFTKGLEIRREIGYLPDIASVYNNLATLKRKQGDYASALINYHYALLQYESLGDSSDVAKVCNQLCIVYRILGNFKQSLDNGFRSLHIREGQPQPDSSEIGKTLMAIGSTFEYKGENERADSTYKIAKRCFETSHEHRELCSVLNNLGNVQEYNSNYEEALGYYKQSYTLRSGLNEPLESAKTLRNIARIHIALRQFPEAKRNFEAALSLLAPTQEVVQATLISADLAELYIWQGKPEIAIQMLTKLIPSLDTLAETSQRIYFREMLSLAMAGTKDMDSSHYWHLAAQQLRHAMDIESNASLYQLDDYITVKMENLDLKLTQQELQLQKERGRMLWLGIFSLVIVLVLIILYGLQRIQLLKNRRNAIEHQYKLELKEREVENLEKSKENEFLKISLEVQDSERSRIAQDLHDRVGAQIGAFKHLFGQLRDDFAAASPSFKQSFEKLNGELEELMADVRAVSHDLESPTLKTFGLVAALGGFKDMFARTPGLDFELDVHGLEKRLNARTEHHIYLILKELFNNALKYANPTAFSIQLLKVERQLTVVVEDNGLGFDPQSPRINAGLGLQSIKNRVQYMNGSLKIDSAIGRGTIVTIEIPLQQEMI